MNFGLREAPEERPCCYLNPKGLFLWPVSIFGHVSVWCSCLFISKLSWNWQEFGYLVLKTFLKSVESAGQKVTVTTKSSAFILWGVWICLQIQIHVPSVSYRCDPSPSANSKSCWTGRASWWKKASGSTRSSLTASSQWVPTNQRFSFFVSCCVERAKPHVHCVVELETLTKSVRLSIQLPELTHLKYVLLKWC